MEKQNEYHFHFQRLEDIKSSIQPIPMKPSDVKQKRRRVKKSLRTQQLEYEETHKQLQEKKIKKHSKRSVGRRLYSHNDSLDEISEKENAEHVELEPLPKRARNSLQPVRKLPHRSVKKNNNSIID